MSIYFWFVMLILYAIITPIVYYVSLTTNSIPHYIIIMMTGFGLITSIMYFLIQVSKDKPTFQYQDEVIEE